mmetsp:Transcript_88686/g.214963  ORF Transcript_88686/g.214963 Transcript_88686/m.214963 type:complete len:837 (+) Transcript_88686:2-2512(+)
MLRCCALPLALALLGACGCEGIRAVGRRGRHHHAWRHRRLAALRRQELSRKRAASHSSFLNFTDKLTEGSLSVGEALERVPVRVGDLYVQFKATHDSSQAKQILQELNVVYERAQAQRDRLGFECDERRTDFDRIVKDARTSLQEVEAQLTLLQDRSQRLQTGLDHALAEVNRLQEQFAQHRDKCTLGRQRDREALNLLAQDLPLARQLSEEATEGCAKAGDSPPPLVECSLPGGFLVTFKEAPKRQLVTRLSGLSERLVALNLDRAARGHGRAAKASLLALRSGRRLRGKGKAHGHTALARGSAMRRLHGRAHQLRRSRRHHSLHEHRVKSPRLLQLSAIPDSYCADILRPPTCEMFVDDMATFVGNVEDLARELNVRAAAEEEHCQDSLETYDGQIQTLKRQADNSNVELVNSLAEKSTLEGMRRERRAQLLLVSRESKHGLEECRRELTALSATMCSTRKLRSDLGSNGGFLGDCEVSEWILEPCSKACGGGGTQNMTRQVVRAPEGPERMCPPLIGARACNEKPCPVDGIMGRWGPWSECSRACGGGTRTRTRKVLREPQHAGLPTGETLQERICNPQPCDEDCTLFPWSEWSSCSKACNTGHRVRKRDIRQVALGEGKCPAADAPQRHEMQPCHDHACTEEPLKRCNSSLDLVFALDSSGSAGADGLAAARDFAKAVTDRMNFGEYLAKTGAVYFGDSAVEAQALTVDQSALQSKLAQLPSLGTKTNSGEALALAGELLGRDGRLSALQAVVVITDGMPVSSYIMSTAAKRLKISGVRVVFVLVGPGLSKQAVKSWASQPVEENIVKAPTYASLNQTRVTELLANLCPSLE